MCRKRMIGRKYSGVSGRRVGMQTAHELRNNSTISVELQLNSYRFRSLPAVEKEDRTDERRVNGCKKIDNRYYLIPPSLTVCPSSSDSLRKSAGEGETPSYLHFLLIFYNKNIFWNLSPAVSSSLHSRMHKEPMKLMPIE